MLTDTPAPALLDHCKQGPAAMLAYAAQQGASDLHWTPLAQDYELKVRIRGALHTAGRVNQHEGRRMVQALKAAGQMNITEFRKPQDARVQFDQVQARLSTHPCIHGECLVIRILTGHRSKPLDALGFSANSLERVLQLIALPEGLTLISGPTGSGKTTTLHGALKSLGERAGQIVTLEDPVEIVNTQARQTDLSTLPHLSFAQGLKSLMRQDPDTILVGEIRDAETAQLTLNAALTGHRVLASVHAPDALGTVARLCELGTPLKTLLISLNGVLSLRLQTTGKDDELRVWSELLSIHRIPRAEVLELDSLLKLHQASARHQALHSFAEDWNVLV